MDRPAEVKCFWCDMDMSPEAWNAPDNPLPITHEMVHAFMQAFPEIEPRSMLDLEPQDYLGSDIYFSTSEWPIFDLWAAQQGYWPIDAVLARAVERDTNEKRIREEQSAARSADRRRAHNLLSEDELPF